MTDVFADLERTIFYSDGSLACGHEFRTTGSPREDGPEKRVTPCDLRPRRCAAAGCAGVTLPAEANPALPPIASQLIAPRAITAIIARRSGRGGFFKPLVTALLGRAEVSQAGFARLAGVTPRQVNNWCRGRAAVPR
jgi:hypothetical protein